MSLLNGWQVIWKMLRNYPVKSSVEPGDIFSKIPDNPPEHAEPFSHLMKDLDEIIMPGITHWQNPNFFAYFPANTSPPSILAEMIISTLGAQCMIWETSPAAAELEEKMMIWLRDMIGLPSGFEGVIQDSASTATLAAILTAREKIKRIFNQYMKVQNIQEHSGFIVQIRHILLLKRL